VKFLFFTPYYHPATRYGGPVRSVHGLARALVGLGHVVHVITTNVDGPNELNVPLDSIVDVDGVSVRYFPIQTPRRILFSPLMAKRVEELVSEFDVVYINGVYLWPGPKIGKIARKANKHVILAPRGMLIPELISGKSAVPKRLWIRLMERSNLKNASAIHVTSSEEQRGIDALGIEMPPTHIIPNGVELPEQSPSAEDIEALWGGIPKGKRVAIMGRLAWQKGVDTAIEAVRLHGDSVILIAGPDEAGLREKLESRLSIKNKELGRFTGELLGTDKWALLYGADVVVMPSEKESFGMTAIEAMAVRTSVIASTGVGVSEIMAPIDQDSVVPKTASHFANALDVFLSDDVRRSNFGVALQERIAQDYTWHSVAKRFESLVRDLVKRAESAKEYE